MRGGGALANVVLNAVFILMIQGITRGERRQLESYCRTEIREDIRPTGGQNSFEGFCPAVSVDLSRVVEEQADVAKRLGSSVTVDAEIPFSVSVQADEMLEEVSHNLFTNVVELNDTDEPHVTVADNGPEIPAVLNRC